MDPQQFDLEDLEEVRVNAMERAKACAKKTLSKERATAQEWAAAAIQAALRRLVADKLTQHTENQEARTVLFDVESFL